MRILLFFISYIQLASLLFAQTNNNSSGNLDVHKEYKESLFQVAPRMDFIFHKHKINVYATSAINGYYAYKSLVENRKWYVQAGIDIGVSEKWYMGLSIRANGGTSNFNIYNYTTKFYVQHRGKIGQLIFFKDISYEHFNFSAKTMYNISPTGSNYSRRSSEGRAGGGFGLGKYFSINENYIAVFLSYKAYLQFDFDDNGNSVYKNRFIDYTALRLDVGYLISHVWYVGFYATRDTNFMYVPASMAYNENRITPIVGIACNLLLYSKPKNEKPLSSFRYFYTQ